MTPPEPASATTSALRAAGCVFAEEEARLLVAQARTAGELAAMLARRVAGLPLEVILGWAQFGELRVAVAADVFVPRRRTEFLVRQAATLTRPGCVVVDLCCGSGAVGAALAAQVGGVELVAADIDPAAVQCARGNVMAASGLVYEGDLYDALPSRLQGRVQVLVVNAPYVPTDQIPLMPPEARDHEPWVALDGGPDGVDVQRRVAAGAAAWLAPGGKLLIETSERQVGLTEAAMTENGLLTRTRSSAEFSATVVIGTRPADPR